VIGPAGHGCIAAATEFLPRILDFFEKARTPCARSEGCLSASAAYRKKEIAKGVVARTSSALE
jgi:hypothetical protein